MAKNVGKNEKEKQINEKLEEIRETKERKKIAAHNLLEKNISEQDIKNRERQEKSLEAETQVKKKLSKHFDNLEAERKQIEIYISEKSINRL